jgi:dTDP-glucose 4,6-dehydratase
MTSLDPASVTGLRVVVTGGAGFVGSWLCERLLHHGARVVCVDDFSTGSRRSVRHLDGCPGFTLLEQDVSQGLDVDGDVDLVLHLASPAAPGHDRRPPIETLEVGSLGTLHALELARRTEARFVLASTSEVYGDPQEHPQRETYWGNVDPVGPRSVYDESKRFAETLTAAYRSDRGVDTGIVRIFNTYGPRMPVGDGRAVPAFISQALRGDSLTVAGDGSQTRSLCYVDDTVDGLVRMGLSDHPGPVNLGSWHEVTMLELAHRVAALARSGSPIEFVALPADEPRLRRPDTSRAAELLRWRPHVELDDGLLRTLEWFAAQPGVERRTAVGVAGGG